MLSRSTSSKLCQSCRSDLQLLFEYGFDGSRSSRQLPRSRSRVPIRPQPLRPFATTHAQRSDNIGKRHETNPQVSTGVDSRLASLENEVHASLSVLPDLHSEYFDAFQNVLGDEPSPKSRKEGVESRLQDDIHREIVSRRSSGVSAEALAQLARESYGEALPSGVLRDEEFHAYRRLYGDPVNPEGQDELESLDAENLDSGSEADSIQLLREDEDGDLEVVERADEGEPLSEGRQLQQSELTRLLSVAKELGAQVYEPLDPDEEDSETDPSMPRINPLTLIGKFATSPSTVNLSPQTFVQPVQSILSPFANKHLYQKSHQLFGMPGLPYSPSTPNSQKGLPKKPIPLDASQHTMGEMEANVYLAAVMPQVYASVTGILVEVRKRLGTAWLQGLLDQQGGPRILDAGAAGAGILAWREVVKAEWASLHHDQPESKAPLGQSTVLTGADTLRHRASTLLEDTTFLPRLPDYVHVRDAPTLDDDRPPPQRKQYDVIIAPHTLWSLKEEWMRKHQVQNLWSMLEPNGGVLILLEKGVARGFEAIAAARDMLLERFISSPGSRQYEEALQAPEEARFVKKGTGMIIAPCTNHEKCPMYLIPGQASGRKDICSFEQRFLRPNFLQRIVGATDTNHEDVAFSYVAVQKGQDQRDSEGLVQGKVASDSAFEGFEADENGQAPRNFSALALPRAVWPPMKRRGHVILDLCTPEGKLERWTVPRSHGRQAYRDARKSGWGDLWALGAKTRVPRNIRVGDRKNPTQTERLLQKAEAMAQDIEEQKLEEALIAKELEDDIDDDAEPLFNDNVQDWNEELMGISSKGKKSGAGSGKVAKLRAQAGQSKFLKSGSEVPEGKQPKWKMKMLKHQAKKAGRKSSPRISPKAIDRAMEGP